MIVYKHNFTDDDNMGLWLNSVLEEISKLVDTPKDTSRVVLKDERVTANPRKAYKGTKNFFPLFCPEIKDVWFREPATIVWFKDGTKTTAVAGHGDKFDKEVGLSICMLKRVLGNQKYRKIMDKWCYDKESLN